MKKFLTLIIGAAAFISPLSAAQINSSIIPEETKVVAHIDFDMFRSSKLGELTEFFKGEDSPELKEISEKLGFDPSTELSSLTAYAANIEFENNGGVIIAQTNKPVISESKIISTIKSSDDAGEIKSEKVNGKTVYSISEDGSSNVASFSILDDKTIILSNSKDQLTSASKAISSKSGSYKGLSTTPKGSFFMLSLAGINEIEADDSNPQAQMIKQVEKVTCFAGEADETAFLNVNITTLDASSATQIQQMAQGMLPFMAMQASQANPKAAEFLQKLKITANGKDVVISTSCPAADFIAMVKEMSQEQEDPTMTPMPATPMIQ